MRHSTADVAKPRSAISFFIQPNRLFYSNDRLWLSSESKNALI